MTPIQSEQSQTNQVHTNQVHANKDALDAMSTGNPDEPVTMLNMLRDPDYQMIAPIRAAALADSRLIETSQLLPKG
jgi:hypothetical protein